MCGTPKRSEDPPVAWSILPARQSSPTAVILKIYCFIAEQVGAKHGGLMIRAASRSRIQQNQPAFLAGGRDDLVSFVGKDRRRIVGIEIAFEQPFPVGWGVVVLHDYLGALDLCPDDTVGILLLRRVIGAVAGGKPGGSVGIEGSSTAAPHSAAFRDPGLHWMIQIVEMNGSHRLDGGHPEGVSIKVHGPRFALF